MALILQIIDNVPERDEVNSFRLIQKSRKILCNIKLLAISKAHYYVHVCVCVSYVCVGSSSNMYRTNYYL